MLGHLDPWATAGVACRRPGAGEQPARSFPRGPGPAPPLLSPHRTQPGTEPVRVGLAGLAALVEDRPRRRRRKALRRTVEVGLRRRPALDRRRGHRPHLGRGRSSDTPRSQSRGRSAAGPGQNRGRWLDLTRPAWMPMTHWPASGRSSQATSPDHRPERQLSAAPQAVMPPCRRASTSGPGSWSAAGSGGIDLPAPRSVTAWAAWSGLDPARWRSPTGTSVNLYKLASAALPPSRPAGDRGRRRRLPYRSLRP